MRKLTALSVALSLSAAGQVFAGEPHATHAAPPHVVAAGKEKSEVPKAEANLEVKAVEAVEIHPYLNPGTVKARFINIDDGNNGRLRNEVAVAKADNNPANYVEVKAVAKTAEIDAEKIGEKIAETAKIDAKKIGEKIGEKIGDALLTEAEKYDPKNIDAMKTAEKVEAEKDRIVNTVDNVKTADAPNSGGATAAATAESQKATGK
jgi:hypothetical protein